MIRPLIALSAPAVAAVLVAPSASADPSADLAHLMPRGYTGETCHAFDAQTAVMAVNCEAIPGGPERGVFVLLDSPDSSNHHFQNIYDGRGGEPAFVAAPCPETSTAATAQWSGGRMGCGSIEDASMILYTNGPMVGMVRGSDPGALLDWWKSAAL